jgi:hypothetical protein
MRRIQDVGLLQGIRIVFLGRGVTPKMLAATELQDAELQLLHAEAMLEDAQALRTKLVGRVNRLRKSISETE